MKLIAEELSGCTYPGRGIVIGKSEDGKRLSVLILLWAEVKTAETEYLLKMDRVSELKPLTLPNFLDPSLIIYAPVRVLGNKTIVTNGDQTDTIYELMNKEHTFEQALQTREFEPDAPNYTPRISGIMNIDNGDYSYKMSILKSNHGNPCACNRYTFSYSNPVDGEGHYIHTYMGDGNPLPSFEENLYRLLYQAIFIHLQRPFGKI